MRILTLLAAFACASGVGGETALDQRLTDLSSEPGFELFLVCSRAHLPCGEQLASSRARVHKKGLLTKFSGTAHDALKAIAAGMPGYHLKISGGVANIAPTHIKDDPLAKQIAEIDLEGVSIDSAAAAACGLAGIRLNRPHAFRGAVSTFGTVSIHSKNISVRDALNNLVRQDGESAWYFEPTDVPGEYRVVISSWRQLTRK